MPRQPKVVARHINKYIYTNYPLASSYFVVSRTALRRQLQLWSRALPFVQPFYAVKCNNDATLMRWMTELDRTLGFDCASQREVNDALQIVRPDRILYAQPCKRMEDIKAVADKGVRTTVVDSVEEVEKLAGWQGDVLVRLLVEDKGSKQPFGKKFGAPLAWIPRIAEAALAHNVALTGFSFHVGSECQDPAQYTAAIEECKKASILLHDYGFRTNVVDIGGGFLPDERSFTAVARCVDKAMAAWSPSTHWIAEPGRFLAAPTHTLYTKVIGKKPVWPPPEDDYTDPTWRITVDESVYGAFSNIPFDGQKPTLERVEPTYRRAVTKVRPTRVFGRTCDSGDLIADATELPEVGVGDWLRVRTMGAYTTVTSSEFNGFPKPRCVYELQ
jgi:ornithine decarboxylase